MLRSLLFSFVLLSVGACGSSSSDKAGGQKAEPASYYVCRYENPFTHVDECREYRGASFDEAAAKKACAKPFTSVVGKLSKIACPSEGAIGTCSEGVGTPELVVTWAYGGFRTIYAGACERFVKGKWSDEARAPVAEPPIRLMDEAKRALVSDDAIAVEPRCDDEVCLQNLARAGGAIWFVPRNQPAPDALVIYPGAAVDPRAYAPFARAIASLGIAVAVAPMEGNLALTGIDRFSQLVSSGRTFKRWFLAGHSMGGAMAARYAARGERRDLLAGLILWAAYPPEDDNLSAAPLPVLSVFASEDGRTTVEEVEANKKLLPASTRYERIEGGNHAQFGFYGFQEEDRPALIERIEQQDMVVAATVSFMRNVGKEVALDARYEQAKARDLTMCEEAQRTLPNLEGLAAQKVTSEEILNPKGFAVAKAKLERGASSRVSAVQRTIRRGQTESASAPAIVDRSVWCKLKSQDVLATGFSLKPKGPEQTCSDLNDATIAWARALLTKEERDAVAKLSFVLEPDQMFKTGPEWLSEGTLEIGAGAKPSELRVRSGSLVVPFDAPVDEAFRGVHYCKLLASQEALLRLLSAATRDSKGVSSDR